MVATLQPMVEELLKHRTHYHAQLFRLTRTDTVQLFLTSASSSLVYEGDTYTPLGGVQASAFRGETALRESGVDYEGIISSDEITAEDLAAGRYRGAIVEVFLVDWRFPWMDAILKRKYTLGDVGFDGERWEAEAWGVGRRLQQKVGDRMMRTCVHDLGSDSTISDFDCRKDLSGEPLTNTGKNVGTVTDNRVFRVNNLQTGPDLGDDYFKDGEITPEDGLNAGILREIKSSTDEGSGSHTIELYVPFPFTIQTGDLVTLITGCLKRPKTDCEGKHANKVNNGAFPFLPGTDKLMKVPKNK